jgi:hypothetical protein
MTIQYSMEWNEILGDMVDDVREYDNTSHNPDRQYEEEQALIHEAIADEQELTSADLDDWYASLIDDALRQEEVEIWADFWNDKETA